MKTFIIAEAGVNHNGSMENAKKLVDIAVIAGCDAVKFQNFKAEKLVTKEAKKAEYQIKNTKNNESQFNMLKKLELSYENTLELMQYCSNKNIKFMSTPFDEESADMLEKLGMDVFKIPSGEITNKPFLKHIAKLKKKIILSTGMATLGEVEEALKWIYEEGNSDVTVLHCTTNYPTAYEDVNLNAMLTLKNAFRVNVGYSDHTKGIEVPIAAMTIGAEVIEKHFTIDRNMEGPDHKASLEPEELKAMVQAIRNIEKCFGDGIKRPTEAEKKNISIARKSIVAIKNINKGEIIQEASIGTKRPGDGLSPKFYEYLIGKKVKRDIKEDEAIKLEDLI